MRMVSSAQERMVAVPVQRYAPEKKINKIKIKFNKIMQRNSTLIQHNITQQNYTTQTQQLCCQDLSPNFSNQSQWQNHRKSSL